MTEINYMCLVQLKLPLLILLLADVNRAILLNQGCFLPSIKYKNYDSQTNFEVQTVINYKLQLKENPVIEGGGKATWRRLKRNNHIFLYEAANPKQAW